jgi:hypothetical protein
VAQRLCACGSSVDVNGTPTTSALFHTVFNVQSTRYFEWQSRHFMFWAKVPLLAARPEFIRADRSSLAAASEAAR